MKERATLSDYPQMFRVRQLRERPRIDDIGSEVARELGGLHLEEKVQPGESIAVTAGSRGIANIALILQALVRHLKRLGAEPFIVPAMGSHGGGTAEGQRKIIESYGVTEEFVGGPIRSTMETVIVCRTADGIPVHLDRYAHEADHVLVCGRVKPHTNFVGDIESGLMKMILIGLGKHAGAKIYHRAIQDYSFGQIVNSVATEVISGCGVVAGLAVVENPYGETAKISAVSPEELVAREKELLVLARKLMPRLPFDRADIVIIDEIGKDISGSGMDTNVVGRKYHNHSAADDEYPRVKQIIVRGLSERTHGNAAGIGVAEFCLTRVLRQMDREATRMNCLTGGRASSAMQPLDYESDRELLDVVLPTIGLTEPQDARILWIRNTSHLEEVECSGVYLSEARERDDLEILTEVRGFEFNADGSFLDFEPRSVST